MKKIVLFLLIGAFGYTINAQPKAVSQAKKIISSEEQLFMSAEWSPDGESFAFSSEKFKGIWISDAAGINVRKITSDQNAGFGYKWSADGNTILARPVFVENNKRYHQVKLYDIATREESVLVQRTRSLGGLPVWLNGGQTVAMKIGGEVIKADTGKPSLKRSSDNEKSIDFGGSLVSASGEVASEEVAFPQFDGRYIFNRQVSPDGTKIVFEVSGLGLHVSNADGSDVKHLGYGEHASWMPDNRYVAVVKVEDDGYSITSGDLFAVDTQTGDYHLLFSGDDKIALKPSVSPDGTKILFDNPNDGSIYLLEIN